MLPYCIGGKDTDEVLFNINYDPCASSLRRMNERYASWYFYFRRGRYDYIVADTFKTVEQRKQRLITLDQLLKEDDSIIPPDVLSLDAQGSEYEILEGAGNTLSSNVLAIITEVEFRPLYDGQKLFGDICDLSRSKSFEFVKFLKDFGEYTPYRGPIGLRAEGLDRKSVV